MTINKLDEKKRSLIWTGERTIPEEGRYMYRRHLKAYEFAADFCRNKVVLDAACGEGYGAEYLSRYAAKVVGVDISEDAINHAKENYLRENLEFSVKDVVSMDFPDCLFDVVASFQTIEHLAEPVKFLESVKRILKTEGHAIISVPNKSAVRRLRHLKWHAKDYNFKEFSGLLDNCFSEVAYYGVCLKGWSGLKVYLLNMALKLDLFNLRRIFTSFFRRRILTAIEKTVLLDISDKGLGRSLDMIALCRK